ncbi:MAG: DNA damage-inducible protein D [Roseburia sp.]|nr:DNA damage-inducible protein D [Roseburia sp.]
MNELTPIQKKLFDDIKHIDDNGHEYWFARELQTLLQYAKWENFHKVIKTAQIACKISQQSVEDCFPEVRKSIISGKGRRTEIIDYKLNRYACYLIVMNGDPRKEVIALGQTYFAVKTREQEMAELYDRLTEDEKRLFIRGSIKQKNMLLAEAAHRAGIITQREYAIFQDAGYMGLYGGMTARDIAEHKGLEDGEEILDYMGGEELAANLFRITQTEAKMRREHTDTPEKANAAHYKIGTIVRKAIEEAGGTMPEELPTPEKSIKQLEAEQRKQIKPPKDD